MSKPRFPNYARVVVINNELATYGKHGIVISTNFDVQVDGFVTGTYYVMPERVTVKLDNGRVIGYSPSSLDYETRVEKTRERKENKEMLAGYKRIVEVSFGQNSYKTYAYADYDHPDIKVGDKAVVDVRGEYKVVEVVCVTDPAEYGGYPATAEIVDVVDTSGYKNRIETRKKRKELENKLETAASKRSKMYMYEQMAKDDPEMMNMLEELKNLESV